MRAVWIVIVSGIFLAACGTTSGPVRQFTKGKELAYYDFSQPGAFEEGQYGGVYGGVSLEVVDNVYRIRLTQGDSELWWGQWGESYDDVVIDVDVDQITERNENSYGVMCRVRGNVISPGQRAATEPGVAFLATQVAVSGFGTPSEATPEATVAVAVESTPEVTPEATVEATPEATVEPTQAAVSGYSEGDGYLFLIQGSGSYAIVRSSGRAITYLAKWTPSDIVQVGPGKNHLRAVCMGDYLAFYINGKFAADVIDDTYNTGQVGLAASASNRLGVRVDFDNLQVSEALPAQ